MQVFRSLGCGVKLLWIQSPVTLPDQGQPALSSLVFLIRTMSGAVVPNPRAVMKSE